jgi:dipeptidyl aminopeptidase/acylaminoacyl peptidase
MRGLLRPIVLSAFACWLSLSPALAEPELTLEKIMSHPSWIGQWPEAVCFGPGGDTIMFLRKKATRGTEVVEIDSRGRSLATFDTGSLPEEVSRWGGRAVFSWQGDLFLADPQRHRLTRTSQRETNPRWLDGLRFVYQEGGGLTLREVATGSQQQLARLSSSEDPESQPQSFVQQQQDRLFPVLKEREEQQRLEAASQGIPELHLGAGRQAVRSEVTPDLRQLLVVTVPEERAKADRMPNYLTRDGYVETVELRTKVGEDPAVHHSLLLFSLHDQSRREISYQGLPRWTSDRPLRIEDARWSKTGRLALMLLSQDFEDRWLVEVDFSHARLKLIEHLHDPAWHSWDLNEFGWTEDGKTFWYQSEKTGYAHLYLWDGSNSRSLTSGRFEVTSIKPSPDGRHFFYRANRERPSQYDVYRVNREGQSEKITTLGGNTGYDLSPDGQQIVFLHSTIDHPPEVYLQKAAPAAPASRLTHSTTPEFEGIVWTVPSIVAVPSTHQQRPVPAKLYLPRGGATAGGPAVVFVHGAGYLQNSDEAWSYYFREFMFHTLLNQLGVTVLDMDYRASAGYGREWRTAIYRQMGTPELEDLQDGVAYLVREHGVSADRVGVYGGSYGGFMTLMAMFKAPDLFACGAALRPVTDWAQYEHEYTARILNTPDEDPESYLRSSPIEFAEGLKNPLLMCHGMLDDNVVAQDTVRLTQRLIQLEKENWEMALYPLESHGFVEPSSWLDEYRRVLKLFRTHLRF